MKITVEVADLEPGATNSQAVADYVSTMFQIRALKRAMIVALVQADRRAQRLTTSELHEANGLLYSREARRLPGGSRNE